MREINECTAEVFRRSEKRIKAHKRNRNRILALCIPFCLIITICSVTIFPTMLPTNDKNMSTGGTIDIINDVYNGATVFTQVEVENIGISTQSSLVNDDANEVTQIYYTMQSVFFDVDDGNKEPANTYPSADDKNKRIEDYAQIGTTAMSSGYRIIFCTKSGTRVVYSLTGNKLIDESTKQEVTLSTEKKSEIFSLLGLAITWKEDIK